MKQGNEVISGRHAAQRGRTRAETAVSGRRVLSPAAEPRAGDGLVVGEDRRRRIAEAAYFRAQARGFAPGQEIEDWLQVEAEIDRMLRGA